MITAAILVNGNPIMARSAHRVAEGGMVDGTTYYKCDDGGIIAHDPEDGAVKLAIKLLERLDEE